MNFRELRKNLMIIGNTIDILKPSRELSLVKTNVQQAMMWTGTYMKFTKLGDNPYAKHDGNRKTVADIEPMFDATSTTIDKEFIKEGLIPTIDKLRSYLGQISDNLTFYMTDRKGLNEVEMNLPSENIVQSNISLFNIYTNVSQSRMWLGMQLGAIRDEKLGK